ncbi:protein fem-1 homolog C-like [Mytilus trossulus]|uniref:protein fem-1 homolog C-like n=1 Tax=Mytilus trossulus TaxID=6551 RepID=UPI0030073697
MLINNKAHINKCRDTGELPLYVACQNGHTEVVQMLINNKADINKCRDTGASPIFIACYKGHAEIVGFLLKHKADCNHKWKGLTPLGIAKREKHTNLVHLLERWNKQSI